MDPETPATQRHLDEAFELVAVLDPAPVPADDDWLPGEFDIA